jgi:hypothetical protein
MAMAKPAKKAKGEGDKAISKAWQGWGEVKFENAFGASNAVSKMNQTNMLGSTLSVMLDPKDDTNIIVEGVSAYAEWQDLKDHFADVGAIEPCGSIPPVFRASVAGETPGRKQTGEMPSVRRVRAPFACETPRSPHLVEVPRFRAPVVGEKPRNSDWFPGRAGYSYPKRRPTQTGSQ